LDSKIEGFSVLSISDVHETHVSSKNRINGRLVVVEGIDGSGKSTQIHLLDKWLRSLGMLVFSTEWNSSDVVKEITSKGKKKGLLTPTTFSLLHATDFADRFERNIFPLLRAGYIVLSDRYTFTAFARDIVRGCSPTWVRKLYAFAVQPDLTFYFRVPVDVAVDRILTGRTKLKYYEAGMDLNLSNDPIESYRIFQSRIVDEYESMAVREDFTVVDGTRNIEEQQTIVRQRVMKILPNGYRTKIAAAIRETC
jgi:dTMP kinase